MIFSLIPVSSRGDPDSGLAGPPVEGEQSVKTTLGGQTKGWVGLAGHQGRLTVIITTPHCCLTEFCLSYFARLNNIKLDQLYLVITYINIPCSAQLGTPRKDKLLARIKGKGFPYKIKFSINTKPKKEPSIYNLVTISVSQVLKHI